MPIEFFALLIAFTFSIGCCCETGPEVGIDCDECDTGKAPANYQATFDNVEDDNCTSCDDYNTTTFILAQIGSLCAWDWSGTLPCDGETSPMCKLQLDFLSSPLRYRFIVLNGVIPTCNGFEAQWVSGSFSDPHDCLNTTHTGAAILDFTEQLHCKWDTATTPATLNLEAV